MRPADLVLPLFVKEGIAEPRPVGSMPGVMQHTRESLRKAAADAVDAGVGGLILFGIPAAKDAAARPPTIRTGIVQLALADLAAEVGNDIVLMADLCLDEYTDHGHCGPLTPSGDVDNDVTLERYASIAVAQAAAGCPRGGPERDDGRPGRRDQDGAGRGRLRRDRRSAPTRPSTPRPSTVRSARRPRARRSSATGPPTSRIRRAPDEALREVLLDVDEGADIVMVKPALAYLDMISKVSAAVPLPLAAYQVSGEYAMVEAAAANGWLDRDRVDHGDAHRDPPRGRRASS